MDYRDVTVEKKIWTREKVWSLSLGWYRTRSAGWQKMPGCLSCCGGIWRWLFRYWFGSCWNRREMPTGIIYGFYFLWLLFLVHCGVGGSGRNGEDLCRPYHRICVDCIRTKCFSALLCGCLLVGYSHSLHNSVAYGYGYGVDRTDCRHEGGYSGRCIGSIVVVGLFLYTRYQSNAVFCVGLCFYDGDTGAYDEPGGLSKQERNCLCLRN